MSNLRRQKSSDPPSHRTEQRGGGESAEASSPVKEDSQSKSPFDIPAKNPNEESLRRWRRHTLTLNPSRRFRYTKRFRVGTMALVYLGRLQKNVAPPSSAPKVDKDKKPGVVGGTARGGELTADALEKLVNDRDSDALSEAGGPRGILASLQTGADQGILDSSPEEIVHRKQKYGENTYPHKPSRTFLSYVWEAFHDRTLIILLVCAALSLAFGIKSDGIAEGWYEGTSIGAAVCLVILVTAVSDYKQGLQFQGLNDEKNNIQVEVIRGGRRMRISIYELVVGDIVPFNLGDQIPGDGILVDGHSVKIDSSSMTGETELLKASAEHPFLQSGCKVADGYGTMVITGVGMHTEWGKLMTSISEDNDEETPLQVRLNGVATLIGKIGLSVAGLVFVILIIFYFVGHSAPSEGTPMFKAGTTSISDAINVVVDIFAIGVTIIVVAVPEGLPLAVTLTLAYSMRKMMADKALVRRLAACETMGSATTICSDKTGTLTVNEMTIVKAWVAGNVREAAAEDIQGLDPKLVGLLHEGISQNSSGSVFILENGKPEVTGSPTEKAALFWGIKMGMDFTKVRAQSNVLQVETFNSEKKRAGVAVKPSNEEVVHIHWKGAAEIVVGVCDRCVTEDGSAIEMTEEKRKELLNVIEGMAASSLRCVAFAYRNLDESEMPSSGATITDKQWPESWAIPETRLALLAIVGIKDPCRPGVFDAVRLCQGAGVRVRMLTGDNLVTAKAIATECGILREGDLSMEGSTFRNYTDAERRKVLPSISVMARSLPSDKLMMIKALKAMGEVVAVTGDGTNDAPALHEADIGLSMGIQGTEVAKESSDIIILDDDFRSVVKVVRWGRSVYANIQKFIQFQLTVNVAALSINFVSAVSSGTVPLTAVQLLWVNLIMDTLGALALATEPPTDELMRWAPVGRSKPLITNVMWRNLLGQSLFQVIVLLTFQFKGEDIFKLRGKPDSRVIKDTIIFNTFVLCQVFNEVNARKPTEFNIFKGLLGNRMFLGIIATTLILQVLIVEFLSKFAATHKLTWQLWLICIGIAFLSWPIALLVKLIPVPPDKDDASCGFVSKKKKKKIALAKEALEKEDVENANHSNTNNNNSSKSQFDLTEKESKSQQQKSPSHNNNNNNNNNNGNVANGK